MAAITESIRNYFLQSGMSVRKLHLGTGLPRPTIANFRDGKPVNSQTLDKIAEFLGAEVMFKEPERQPKQKKRA